MQKAPKHRLQQKLFKVFLTGIAVDFDREELTEFFMSRFPSVIRIDLIKQKKDPTSNRGFGFIELLDRKDHQAILRQEYFRFSGRLFSAKEHKTGKDLERYKDAVEQRRLFVCNVDLDVTDRELKAFFSDYANIEHAYLVNRKQGASGSGVYHHSNYQGRIGYGYVVVKNPSDGDKILEISEFWIRGQRVLVKPFDSAKHRRHEKRSKKLNSHQGKKSQGFVVHTESKEAQKNPKEGSFNSIENKWKGKTPQNQLTKKYDFLRHSEQGGLSQRRQTNNEMGSHPTEEFAQMSASEGVRRGGYSNLKRQNNALRSSQPPEFYKNESSNQSRLKCQKNSKIQKNTKKSNFVENHQLERITSRKSAPIVRQGTSNYRIPHDQQSGAFHQEASGSSTAARSQFQGARRAHHQAHSESRGHSQREIPLDSNFSYESRASAGPNKRLLNESSLKPEHGEHQNQPLSRIIEEFSGFPKEQQVIPTHPAARDHHQGFKTNSSDLDNEEDTSASPNQNQQPLFLLDRRYPHQARSTINRGSPQQPAAGGAQIPSNAVGEWELREEDEEEVLSISIGSSSSSTSAPLYIPRSLPADSRDAIKNHLMSHRVHQNHDRHNILMKIWSDRSVVEKRAQKFKQ